MPKISIIMSVYNEQSDFLKKSTESMLSQSFTDFEFLIINDGSQKETSDILKEFAKKDPRIILLRNDYNMGLTRSLNIAINKSRGELIARMDSDDVSLPDRLENQLDYLLKNNLDFLGSDCVIIDKNEKILKSKKICIPIDIKRALFKGNLFTHSTFFGKRKVFKEFYNEKFKRAQDYEFLLRIAGKNYKLGYMNKNVLKYRINTNGISVKKSKEQEFYAIKARLLALFFYNYNYSFIIYLLKPLISFLLPYKLKYYMIYKIQK